jgi:hypothetical protein
MTNNGFASVLKVLKQQKWAFNFLALIRFLYEVHPGKRSLLRARMIFLTKAR